MDTIVNFFSTQFPGLFSGAVLAWITAYFTWSIPKNKERKEKKENISKSLMYEILYMHRSGLYLSIDKYVSQSFPDNTVYMPIFSTTIYDAHISEIDGLLGSSIALQIHYYYSIIKRLEIIRHTRQNETNENLEKDYINLAAHAYSMLRGAINALSGNPNSEQEIESNLMSLLKDHNNDYDRDKRLLEVYRKKINTI